MYINPIHIVSLLCLMLLPACRMADAYAPLPRVVALPATPLQSDFVNGLGMYQEIELHSDVSLLATDGRQIAVALTTGDIHWFDLESSQSHLFTEGHATGVVDLQFSDTDRLISVGRHAEGYEILRWDTAQGRQDGTARWVENYDLPDPFSPVVSHDGTISYLIQEKTIFFEKKGRQSQLSWPHDVLATAVSDTFSLDDQAFLLIADETGVSIVEIDSNEIIVHYSYEQLLLEPHTADTTYQLIFGSTYLLIAQDNSLRILSVADK